MAARLLLVHSPLVGCAAWELVAADLAGDSYELGVPDLTGTVLTGPSYCLPRAQVVARSACGQPAILTAHSGARSLLAAAGAGDTQSIITSPGQRPSPADLGKAGCSWAAPAATAGHPRRKATSLNRRTVSRTTWCFLPPPLA
jgi:hypothetical protein